MKRVTLTMVLLLLSFGPSVQAQGAKDCVNRENCQASVPCEFMAELVIARAEMRGAGLIVGASSAMNNEVYKAYTDLQKKYGAECPRWESQRAEWEGMRVQPSDLNQCAIGVTDASGNVQSSVDLSALKRLRNTCTEIVEAEDQRQTTLHGACVARRQGLSQRADIDKLQDEQRASYNKVKYLEGSLRRYLMSCVPPADLARELADRGLDALSSRTQAAYEEWWSPRALAPGKR